MTAAKEQRPPYLHIEVEAATFAPDDATYTLEILRRRISDFIATIHGDEVELKLAKVRNGVKP